MTELLEEQRESWGTRGGFILAAVGSAVGLGNLWGFPYKLYSYGGGAFLIPYIVALIVIGIPIMILEFSIGHYTQRAAPDAFKRGHRHFEMVGWWGIILAFVIITYYPVILAYCFSFLWYSIVGIFTGGELPWAGQGIEGVPQTPLGGRRLHVFPPDHAAKPSVGLDVRRLLGKDEFITHGRFSQSDLLPVMLSISTLMISVASSAFSLYAKEPSAYWDMITSRAFRFDSGSSTKEALPKPTTLLYLMVQSQPSFPGTGS